MVGRFRELGALVSSRFSDGLHFRLVCLRASNVLVCWFTSESRDHVDHDQYYEMMTDLMARPPSPDSCSPVVRSCPEISGRQEENYGEGRSFRTQIVCQTMTLLS